MTIISYPPGRSWVCPNCERRHSPRGTWDHIKCNCGMWSNRDGVALWEKKNGDKIALSAMETSHINNCIAMILCRPEIRPGFAKLLIEELERRKQQYGEPLT